MSKKMVFFYSQPLEQWCSNVVLRPAASGHLGVCWKWSLDLQNQTLWGLGPAICVLTSLQETLMQANICEYWPSAKKLEWDPGDLIQPPALDSTVQFSAMSWTVLMQGREDTNVSQAWCYPRTLYIPFFFCFLFVSQAPNIYAVGQAVEPFTTVINTTEPFINNLNVTPVWLTLATVYLMLIACQVPSACHKSACLILSDILFCRWYF